MNRKMESKAYEKQPVYGNWISAGLFRKCAILLLCFGILDAALWIFVQGLLTVKIVMVLPPVFFIVSIGYLYKAKRLFSDDCGGIQNIVIDGLISQIEWNGKGRILDIGCGSGRLAIKLAKKYTRAEIMGVDYWGGAWGYQKKQCEENAALEGVGERTEFLRASASKLPFPDESFDMAVSNLTFHEIRDSRNKLDAVREALRVVKKGGTFVFQDLFLLKSYYGTSEMLTAAFKSMGTTDVHFVDMSAAPFITGVLKLPFMLGALGLICGVKE